MGVWQDFMNAIFSIGWFSALLLIVGLGLLIFEIFTPGFHVPGITGIVLVVLGIAFAAKSLTEAVMLIAIVVVILSVAFVLALRSASKGRLYRSPLILKDAQKNTNGYLSMSDMKYLVGRRGVAGTLLRPAGTGDFDGVRLDVVTDSEYLQKGTLIEIVDVQGRRIVVRAISQQ